MTAPHGFTKCWNMLYTFIQHVQTGWLNGSNIFILCSMSLHQNVWALGSWQRTHQVFFFSPSGPGLAIRIICGDEPYQGSDFAETNIILGQIVDFVTAIKKVRHLWNLFIIYYLLDTGYNSLSTLPNAMSWACPHCSQHFWCTSGKTLDLW